MANWMNTPTPPSATCPGATQPQNQSADGTGVVLWAERRDGCEASFLAWKPRFYDATGVPSGVLRGDGPRLLTPGELKWKYLDGLISSQCEWLKENHLSPFLNPEIWEWVPSGGESTYELISQRRKLLHSDSHCLPKTSSNDNVNKLKSFLSKSFLTLLCRP